MPLSEPIVQLRLAEGRAIQTFLSVLKHDPQSLFAELLDDEVIHGKELIFLECRHRERNLLRFIVDCLRRMHQCPSDEIFEAPEDFERWRELIAEAHYWRLYDLEERLRQAANEYTNTITIGYHGALMGKPGAEQFQTRRVDRILVSVNV
jgi:hypothetical protein